MHSDYNLKTYPITYNKIKIPNENEELFEEFVK
jgi:hypothetical protein